MTEPNNQLPNNLELVIQTCFLGVLLLVIVIGNTFICALVAKFRNLRTYANFLVVEMAMTDLLNGVINIPLFISYEIFPWPILRGRKLAIACLSIRRNFLVQNILSVLAIFIDRYLVLAYGLKYTHRKSSKQLFCAVAIKWMLGTAIVGVIMFFHSEFADIGEAPVSEYIMRYEKRGIFPFSRIILPLFLVIYCVVSAFSWKEIKKTDGFRKALPQWSSKRFQDLKALKTVICIIVCYAICFLPEIVRGILAGTHLNRGEHWLLFFSFFFLLLTSAVNCIIYYARTERFRRALVAFLTSPIEKRDVFDFKIFNPVVPTIVQEAKKIDTLEIPLPGICDEQNEAKDCEGGSSGDGSVCREHHSDWDQCFDTRL